jgi:hypothetical protein
VSALAARGATSANPRATAAMRASLPIYDLLK